MEKQSPRIGRQPQSGAMKLPPGFRFHPTDEELVVQYLRRKALSSPFIPHLDLSLFNPWDLPGGCEQEMYFFAVRGANAAARPTCCGYWKATGQDRAIVSSKLKQVVGVKKTLVFCPSKPPSGSTTRWLMHEYRLPRRPDSAPTRHWVLCRIFPKKIATKTGLGADQRHEGGGQAAGFLDFTIRRPSSPSSSDSSCVTGAMDASSNADDTASTP